MLSYCRYFVQGNCSMLLCNFALLILSRLKGDIVFAVRSNRGCDRLGGNRADRGQNRCHCPERSIEGMMAGVLQSYAQPCRYLLTPRPLKLRSSTFCVIGLIILWLCSQWNWEEFSSDVQLCITSSECFSGRKRFPGCSKSRIGFASTVVGLAQVLTLIQKARCAVSLVHFPLLVDVL